MNPLYLPWLELSIVLAIVGAAGVSLFRDPLHLNADGDDYFTRRLAREVLAPHWRTRTAADQR